MIATVLLLLLLFGAFCRLKVQSRLQHYWSTEKSRQT
jgi:hypothetical protein